MKNNHFYELDNLNIAYEYRDEGSHGEVFSFKDHHDIHYEIRIRKCSDCISIEIHYGGMNVVMEGENLIIRGIDLNEDRGGFILIEFQNKNYDIDRENSIQIYDPVLRGEV